MGFFEATANKKNPPPNISAANQVGMPISIRILFCCLVIYLNCGNHLDGSQSQWVLVAAQFNIPYLHRRPSCVSQNAKIGCVFVGTRFWGFVQGKGRDAILRAKGSGICQTWPSAPRSDFGRSCAVARATTRRKVCFNGGLFLGMLRVSPT